MTFKPLAAAVQRKVPLWPPPIRASASLKQPATSRATPLPRRFIVEAVMRLRRISLNMAASAKQTASLAMTTTSVAAQANVSMAPAAPLSRSTVTTAIPAQMIRVIPTWDASTLKTLHPAPMEMPALPTTCVNLVRASVHPSTAMTTILAP